MSLRNDLAGVLARDPAIPIQAYAFVLEALEYTKELEETGPGAGAAAARRAGRPRLRARALRGSPRPRPEHYGLMALTVLDLWGIRSTSDIGEIVFNLIASGDLEKTPTTRGRDFDHVYDFEAASAATTSWRWTRSPEAEVARDPRWKLEPAEVYPASCSLVAAWVAAVVVFLVWVAGARPRVAA